MATARQKLSAVELFAVRYDELADRVRAREIGFIDAVDMAYSAAQWAGLTESIGDDHVQVIMAAAFGGIADERKP